MMKNKLPVIRRSCGCGCRRALRLCAATWTLLFLVQAQAGMIMTAEGRFQGVVSLDAGAAKVGDKTVKWADVVEIVNDKQTAVLAGEVVRMKNGEVWAGRIEQLAGGNIVLETTAFGRRQVAVADALAIDFMPGLPYAGNEEGGVLYRAKGSPVPGSLLQMDAAKVSVDTVLGAVTLERKDIRRYVLPKAPDAGAAGAAAGVAAADEVTLADGSVLRGTVEPAKDGLVLKHTAMGEQRVRPEAWRSVRRRSASVVFLTDLTPASLVMFPLIRRLADPACEEFARVEPFAAEWPAFVSRLRVWPKTVATYRLPGQAGSKVKLAATVAVDSASRGAARVRFSIGDQMLFDKVVSPADKTPAAVSFEAAGGSELKVEVDFDKNVEFPCSVVLEDPLLIVR